MNNRVLLSALAGGVVAFLAGYLFYGILLKDFFSANSGSATGVMKDPPELWAIAVGSLFWGLLYAMIYNRWAGIKTFKTGAIGGAWVGLLFTLSYDFISYGANNLANMTATLVDPLVGAVMGALVAGTVGWALGYRQGN